jgi:3-oxoacyl-[acyl-carrier protein] reductase
MTTLEQRLSDRLCAAFSLGGRVALVGGAAGGLGHESALVLAEAGATVVCSDIDRAGAAATAQEIRALGGSALDDSVDATSKSDVEAQVARVVADHGRLDIAVNAVGIGQRGPSLEVGEEEYRRLFDINVRATFLACQAVGAVMIDQGHGAIVNVASAAIDIAPVEQVIYSATKAAVAQITRNLAAEWGPMGVRVNALAPGFFPSKITAPRWTDQDGRVDHELESTVRAQFAAPQAMPLPGEAFDQAVQVLYLVSDAARFVTGQIFRANGGLAMPW